MKKIKVSGLMAVSLLRFGAVHASEVTVVSNVLGPEGPLYVDGNLYYVGWISSTLSKWDGKSQHGAEHHAALRPQRPGAHRAQDPAGRLRRTRRDPRSGSVRQAAAPLGHGQPGPQDGRRHQ